MRRPEATPLHIVESYFDTKLKRSTLKKFGEVTEQEWVEFAKHYLEVMEAQFAAQFLDLPAEADARLRLFFEPRMAHEWASAVERLHAPTPLLGLSPDPGDAGKVTRAAVSQMLSPLKKHLLLADSVYIRDSFYYCFDAVADSLDRERWRDDPNEANLVRESVRRLKGWLPILVELRDLIESRALVFMPYWITPSFPYGGNAPGLRDALRRIQVRPLAEGRAPRRTPHWLNTDEILAAWLNARLLGLDPVFPSREMFDWAADLYFKEDAGRDLTSDLISIDILPFGRGEKLDLDDLHAIRGNDDVFGEVRQAVVSCREFLEEDIGPESSPEGLNKASRAFLDDRLAKCEKNSVLRFIEDKPVAGIVVSLAIGAALIPVGPAIGVVAGAVLNPNLALLAARRFSDERRAIGHLQALL